MCNFNTGNFCKFIVAFKSANWISQNTKENNNRKKKNEEFHFTLKLLQRSFYSIIWIIPSASLSHLPNKLSSLRTWKRYLEFLGLFLLPLILNPWWIYKFTRILFTVAEHVYKHFDDPQSALIILQYLTLNFPYDTKYWHV